jgi:hypothetical protein
MPCPAVHIHQPTTTPACFDQRNCTPFGLASNVCSWAILQVPKAEAEVYNIAQTFDNMVGKFLTMLTSDSDQSLRFLSFRIDFNERCVAVFLVRICTPAGSYSTDVDTLLACGWWRVIVHRCVIQVQDDQCRVQGSLLPLSNQPAGKAAARTFRGREADVLGRLNLDMSNEDSVSDVKRHRLLARAPYRQHPPLLLLCSQTVHMYTMRCNTLRCELRLTAVPLCESA